MDIAVETPDQADSLWVKLRSLVAFGTATAFVAYVGSAATSASVNSGWFESLEKPVFYPPSFLFGVVWTMLYVTIAVAGWLAWRNGGGLRTAVPWGIQMAFNLSWTLLFFGVREPVWALAAIVVLLGVAVWTAAAMWEPSRIAGLLFIPYILWVAFATVLNGAIVVLN